MKNDKYSPLIEEQHNLTNQLNKSRKQIYKLSNFDTLTSLPNRNRLINTFNSSIKQGNKTGKAIFLIDVDRFHSINELYGREIGDKLLVEIANRLHGLLGTKNTIFRDNEDEFFIVLDNVSYYEIRQYANEIQHAVNKPYNVDGRMIYITVSIGLSHYPMTAQDIETLLLQAEIAMFKVKNSGKDNFQVFLLEDAEIVERKRKLEFGLNEALENNELFLVYQPKINLDTKEVYSVEALLRWDHPELGLISPGEFIPIAEEAGSIIDIGYWVLEEAIRQTKEWHEMGFKLSASVNVSAIQFGDKNLVSRIIDTLYNYQLEPEYLVIEITESVTRDYKHAEEIIKRLHSHNIKVAIDDFGTGYSSFGLLTNMYIHMIKIDRSFIQDVPENSKNVSLVKTFIQMGENLKFDILAEGIETSEQSNFLIENNCRYGQGFYFSKPVTASELIEYMRKNKIKIK